MDIDLESCDAKNVQLRALNKIAVLRDNHELNNESRIDVFQQNSH